MWPSPEYPVYRAEADFHQALYSSSVALRRLRDFHDDNKFLEGARHEKSAILQKFTNKNRSLTDTCKRSLEEGLEKRLDIHIKRYLERNQHNRKQNEALVQTQEFVDYLCKDFKASVKIYKSVQPNRKVEEFENFLDKEKHRHLTSGLHFELDAKFEERINVLHDQLREEHKKYLEEEQKSLEEMKMDLLEMSKELKHDTSTKKIATIEGDRIVLLWKVLKEEVVKKKKHRKKKRKQTEEVLLDLEETVEDMYNLLLGKRINLRDSYPDIYDKLLRILHDAIKFLREKMTCIAATKTRSATSANNLLSDVIPWAHNLQKNLRECFEDPEQLQLPTIESISSVNETDLPILSEGRIETRRGPIEGRILHSGHLLDLKKINRTNADKLAVVIARQKQCHRRTSRRLKRLPPEFLEGMVEATTSNGELHELKLHVPDRQKTNIMNASTNKKLKLRGGRRALKRLNGEDMENMQELISRECDMKVHDNEKNSNDAIRIESCQDGSGNLWKNEMEMTTMDLISTESIEDVILESENYSEEEDTSAPISKEPLALGTAQIDDKGMQVVISEGTPQETSRKFDMNMSDTYCGINQEGVNMTLDKQKRHYSKNCHAVIQEFRERLRLSLPLEHWSKFYEEEIIRDTADLLATKVLLESFLNKVKINRSIRDRVWKLMNHYCSEVSCGFDDVLTSYLIKNEDHRSQICAFFEKQIMLKCKEFKTSLNASLELNPEMDVKDLEAFVENKTSMTFSSFECLWIRGNSAFFITFNYYQNRLTERLEYLGRKYIERQKGHLESVNCLWKVKGRILEVSRKRKFYDIDEDEMRVKRIQREKYRAMSPARLTSKKLAHITPEFSKEEFVPLLGAILEGRSVWSVEKMLDDGASVHVTTNKNQNAAHLVIWSLIHRKQKTEEALAILDLLVARGFGLINDSNSQGFTPLLLAMQYKDLDEDLLAWFFNQRAYFNAVTDKHRASVLSLAIYNGHGARIIRKILEFRGNPKLVTKSKWNVLHMAARYANKSALKIFIDQFDVNNRTCHGHTPLHLLFMDGDGHLDYEYCLTMLLEKEADFGVRNKEGHVPLVCWMKHGKCNSFPTLMKLRDRLPITQEIASETLTAIVEEMQRLEEFLPSSHGEGHNDLVQFILLLIQEKKGKLQFNDGSKWKLHDWDRLEKVVLENYLHEDRRMRITAARFNWKLYRIKANISAKLDFPTEVNNFGVLINTVLVFLLDGKNYTGFVEVSQCLIPFLRINYFR